jgi:hypothetical protein
MPTKESDKKKSMMAFAFSCGIILVETETVFSSGFPPSPTSTPLKPVVGEG